MTDDNNKNRWKTEHEIAENQISNTKYSVHACFIITMDSSLFALFFIINFFFYLISVSCWLYGRVILNYQLPILRWVIKRACANVPFYIDFCLDKSTIVCCWCCFGCHCCAGCSLAGIYCCCYCYCFHCETKPRAVIFIGMIRFVSLMIIRPPMFNILCQK